MSPTMIEMDDGAQLRTWTTAPVALRRQPVVMVHGGPGVPDYLAPVAEFIEDLCVVHRYDQRGTGGSQWEGEHTIARHIRDLSTLLDTWGHDQVVLLGHSFGTNMINYFLRAQPDRVAGMIQLAGPFLDPWRKSYQASQLERRSAEQQGRLEELEAIGSRTDAEEIEFLTLQWFTDHADQHRAWEWATASAHSQRPVNYAMNSQLNAAKKLDPLETHLDDLRLKTPADSVIIGGAGDSRPADALVRHGARVDCDVVIIDDAGHNPWLEAPEEFSSALRDAVERLTGQS